MPRPSVKRKETLYTSFIVLVCWNDYIVTHRDGISIVILDAELAEGDIREGILAPFAIILRIFVIILSSYATFVSHAYLARLLETIYVR